MTFEHSPTLDDINVVTDLRDPLAGIADAAGWSAAGDAFIARDGKQPRSILGGVMRAAYKAARASSYADAVATARTISSEGAGIGVVLGDRGDGYVLGGLDQDRVRDATTGAILPWARELCDLLPTYTEISLSGTGLHSLFWLAPESVSTMRDAIAKLKRPGASLDCVVWRHPGSAAKAELYLGLRFIALTGWRLRVFPDAPTTIDSDAFL